MNVLQGVCFNAFLRKFGKSPESILKFLPEQDIEVIKNSFTPSAEVTDVFVSPKEATAKIHYSWLLKEVEKFPAKLLPLILSTLPKSQAHSLMKMIDKKFDRIELSNNAILFFNNYLRSKITPEGLLPTAFLPESELNTLLDLDKKKLVVLIDFLGLHDLGLELKKIIDKKILEKIPLLLSAEKQKYLKFCIKQKDQAIAPPLGMKWVASKKVLKNLLQQKGLVRLSLALDGEHKDLVWHISHMLDTGRGDRILSLLSEKKKMNYPKLFKSQVISLIKLLRC